MPRGGNTWQARGTYLAGCLGLTAPIFGAGIDKAMATARQGTAANPGAGERAGATRTRTKRTRRKTREPASAGAAT